VIAAVGFAQAAAGSTARTLDPPPWAHAAAEPPDDVHHDVSLPLRELSPAPPAPDEKKKEKEPKKGPPIPAPSSAPDPVRQSIAGTAAAPALGVGFEGIGEGFSGPSGPFFVTSAPPDPNAVVGPSNIVEVVNQSFAVFDKSGTPVYGPVPTNTLWSGFGGGCESNDNGDATVEYDKLAGRWIVTQFSVGTTPYLQCVAVSTGADPLGAYYRYAFQYANFPDYPKLGVWNDAYYETFNMFRNGTRFVGPEVCAYNRSKMLTGQAATQQCFLLGATFGSLLPADLDGSTPPPAGSPNFVLSFATNSLQLWKFHVDWTTPANTKLTGPTTLPVAAFSPACAGGTCIPQAGTTQQLDSLADRLMYRLSYRNLGDHESLLVNNSVTAGSSVGVRWYELRDPNGTPTVYQQGTYAPDSSYRWLGSLAMDRMGDIALGYSVSSASSFPSIRYTGRLAGDPLGVMTQAEGTIVTGTGSQNGGLSRWGDYTSMSVDPADDCTFWYTDQYLATSGAFNWHTRIASFKFPSCTTGPSDFSLAASPGSLSIPDGSSSSATLSTTVTSGSAQTVSLSAGGQPAGTTVGLSPASVTAGGSSTLTVNVGATTAPGTYTITVTGTGASATHTTTVGLTVTSAPTSDFAIAASPSTLSIVQGGNAGSTISTAVTNGSAQTVGLSASGQPVGTTVSFGPASVTAGSSSTMTVNVGAGTVPGSYTITVTGTGTNATHTTTVGVTVTAAPAPDFSLSASPGSLSAPQGGGGSSTISTAVTSGAAQTVSLSASGQPAGTSVGFNPASVTAGDSSVMTVNVGASTVPGAYTITVTGTGTGTTHTTTVGLTVTPADFSIGASPSSLTIALGATDASTISTAVTSGAPQTVNLSASGQPAGTTVSFSPASVAAGGSSTMTVAVGASTTPGTYVLAITGTGASATHTTSVALTVPAPPHDAVNGGLETGSLGGWTASGVLAPVISTTAHSGSYSARLGAASAFNGNSTLSQVVAIPTGNSVLSFWFQPHCTDTITYDQIQMQIRSTTGATLATVMNVCSNSGAWTSQTFDTSAYAGQTVVLWFNDHDDGYFADPTYFLLDDVAVTPYTVTAGLVQNPSFESGLSSWTAGGAFTPLISGTAHSGSASAQVGSSGAVTGDSTLAQTVLLGLGSSTLTFWYQPHCSDTIVYDQIQMQIRSTTGAILATVLNVCSNSSAWTQVTFDLTPYAGQTVVLWFNDHDDGYPIDPTYFLLDDVVLS
jgi:uncharacterized membrane protein